MIQAVYEFARSYGQEIVVSTREHLVLTALAMLIACLIAVPLGIILARSETRLLKTIVMGIVNVIQPIPSLAFVALTAAGFVLFNEYIARRQVLPTIGLVPGLVALVAYALLPILRNTFTGIQQVDASVKEVARGMGMKPMQVLFSVELPLALPFIMAGIRISTV